VPAGGGSEDAADLFGRATMKHIVAAIVLIISLWAPRSAAAGPDKPRVDEPLEPWASNRHPKDVARRQVEDVTTAKQEYRITHGGTMDGSNCRSPIGGSFGVWDQSWESNRAVRMENVGETDVINPWLSNGRNDFRTLKEIVADALRPGMTDREKAIAFWRLQTTHRFHATTGDAEVNDPVKAINVYGYTTCGDDSICLAGLWKTAGFKVRPARVVGHCITQVHYNGRWNLLDGDMGPFYLLRDNVTIAGEQDLVRDHDLLKRTHTHGILDADSRADAEWSAALFIYEGEAGGDRNSARDTTMNMVLRPNEALTWRWGHRVPLKYHGHADIKVWGQRAADRVCDGLWEYRPDFTAKSWRRGADRVENIRVKDGELVPEAGKAGILVWKMRSPYVFVGGTLQIEGVRAKFSLSWDGTSWQEVGEDLDAQFPAKGPARYEYRLRCELPEGARLKHLAIVNDLQMAPLALPGMLVGENQFVYTDQSTGPRLVRLTHEWVERSISRPPGAPPTPVFPAEGGGTDGTDIVFQWRPPQDSEGGGIADYHFELSERADMAWPLSSNFSKLVSNTADRGKPRYRVPYTGLLSPGREYFWRVRARNQKGVWGPWSKTWNFTPGGPAQPVEVTLEATKEADGNVTLRWKPNAAGRKPVKYRVYGSDEKGFSVSDQRYRRNVGQSLDLPAQAPANFVAETSNTEFVVLGAGLDLPNTNMAFYRVVAVDDKGKRSGPSDYAAAGRPFIYSKPPDNAKVGTEFRYQVSAVRSLGDLRLRIVEGKEVASFWDIEKPRFVLLQGPSWLRIDERTGVLRGVPDAAGNTDVVVEVTLERLVRRLDEPRLSWGQELVKEMVTEKVGSVKQRFRITVAAVPGAQPVALKQESNTWVKRSPLKGTPPSPGMGYETSLGYDPAARLVIRWGGHNQGGGGEQNAETWTFDPATSRWVLRQPNTAPPGVCCAQQNVFDPAASRFLRFPAFSGSHGWQWFREIYLSNSSLWSYDLPSNTWRDLRPLPAPVIRPLRCASWDAEHQVVVLFGGEGSDEGTLVYDPYVNTWARMKPMVQPAPRSGGNMAYDAVHKVHVLFGTQFGDDPHTWTYDLRQNKWRDVKPTKPPSTDRNDAVLVYDTTGQVAIALIRVVDASNGHEVARGHLETWAYDAGKNEWRAMKPAREPDGWTNRSRALVALPDQNLILAEVRVNTTDRTPGAEREQQVWTYRYAEPNPDPAPQPPAGLTVKAEARTVALAWIASPSRDVTGYAVYRGTGAQPWHVEYRQIAKVDKPAVRDEDVKPGVVHHYFVRAVSMGGAESADSVKVRAQPRVVEDVVVSVISAKEVRLSWNPVGDAPGYHIERAPVEVFSEDELVRLKKDTPPLREPSVGAVKMVGQFERLTKQPVKVPGYTDTALDLAKPQTAGNGPLYRHRFHAEQLDTKGAPYRFATYAYRVKAVNALGIEGGPSPYYLTIPSAPQWVFAKEDGEQCRLKWAANPEQGVKGYRVYRMEGPKLNGPGQQVTRLTDEPIEGTTFTDPKATKETKRYWVVAVDALGQEGLPSAPVWHYRQFRKAYEPFVGEWHQ